MYRKSNFHSTTLIFSINYLEILEKKLRNGNQFLPYVNKEGALNAAKESLNKSRYTKVKGNIGMK